MSSTPAGAPRSTRRSIAFISRWIALSIAVTAPPVASAQTAPSGSASANGQQAKVAAQALFDEAMALRKKSAFADACVKLEESLRLDPQPGTKFYLAECMEQTGKLASAWLLYTEVADAMATSGQQKRETFARERSAALAPKLARLQINVPPSARVPGLVVKRDGAVLGAAQWGFAAPVDLGAHTIEATSPNARPFTKTVEVQRQGATVTVDLPELTAPVATGDAAAPCPLPSSSAPPIATASSPPFFDSPLHKIGAGLGGLGVAGVVAGAVLGGAAIAKQNASNKGPCDLATNLCSPDGIALRSEAIGLATGSTVAFVSGGALLAAGVVLLVWPSARPAQTAVLVRPSGLSVEGRW